MACRGRAQSLAGVTEQQAAGLALGRGKGTNHRTGYTHRPDSKAKIGAANKRFWVSHPELAAKRGEQARGPKHYLWNGGSSRLNTSIRQMTENRRWIDAVKARDGGTCTQCGSIDRLESHHRIELAALIESLGIKNRDDARRHAAALWDINNGVTLCGACHDAHHGRTRREAA